MAEYSIQTIKDIIAKTLFTIRQEQEISQDKLCLGICNKVTYSRFESGDRQPDRLTLNALLQRLGKDAGKVSSVLSPEEYAYFMWKRTTLQAAEEEDMEALENLLQRPEAIVNPKNGSENLQRQFLLQMKALIEEADGRRESAIALLKEAVETTLPGFRTDRINRYLISIYEITVLLDMAEQQLQAGETEEAVQLLEAVIRYTDSYYQDPEAKVKIIPRAARLLVLIRMKEGNYLECMVLCQKAIGLLRQLSILYDLAKLMESYLEAASHGLRTEQAVRYEKQLQALKELYREYHADPYQSEHASPYYQNQEIYLIQEVIRCTRIGRDMSQEELSEDICTPENLSRIETGRHTPNARTFRALMEKLGSGQDYYTTGLDTANFMLLEKKRELIRAESLHDYAKARKLLGEIREGLREENTLDRYWNRHILTTEECLLDLCERTGSYDAAFFMRHCEAFFGCEAEGWLKEAFWEQFFSGYKVQLLNQLAMQYAHTERDKAILIWERILKWLKESQVSLIDRYSDSMTAISNLSAHYGMAGRLEECIRICEEGIQLSLSSGRGVRLGKLLVNKAEALSLSGTADEETCRRYVRQAYYLDDLLGPEDSTLYVDRYYRTTYDPYIQWY